MNTTYIEPLRIPFDAECRLYKNGVVVKTWIQKNSGSWLNIHHYPNWMPLKLHLTLEKLIEHKSSWLCKNLVTKAFYHFLHGLICAFSLREVLTFIHAAKQDA